MRHIVTILFLIFVGNSMTGQIDGSLLFGLTQATTTEMNTISNPPLGSLVYNTTDFSIYQYIGSSWTRVFDAANNGTTGTKVNFGGRWTNSDITTNLNVTNVVAPIFGTEDYKDDGNTLYEVIGNTLVVKEDGRYDIRANLSLIGINDGNHQRTNVNARIYIDGNPVGSLSATGYIRFQTNGNFQTSLHVNEILELSSNNIITIVTFQESNTGVVNFSAANESSFIINKLQ